MALFPFLLTLARSFFAPRPELLSQFPPALVIGEELAISTRGRSAGEGQGHRNPSSRRVATSLPTSRIMSATRLAPWRHRSNQWMDCRLWLRSIRIVAEQTSGHSPQPYSASYGCMDSPTAHRGLSGRLGDALFAQGSRSNLRGRISTASKGNAD